MAEGDRPVISIDPAILDTVQRVAEWTGRTPEQLVRDALVAYLDEQVAVVVDEEIQAVRAERRARAHRAAS